jgi:hypothetical protein
MSLKPFRIVETPPDPPTFDELARQHRLSKEEKSAIKQFAFSVRHDESTARRGSRKSTNVRARKSAGKIRLRSESRAVTRKK